MDIGPGNKTAALLRVLANQLEKDDAPDFFLVLSLEKNTVDYAWRTTTSCFELLGAVELKLVELKNEIIETKVTLL